MSYRYSYWFDTSSRLYKFSSLDYLSSWITGVHIPVGTMRHTPSSRRTFNR